MVEKNILLSTIPLDIYSIVVHERADFNPMKFSP
jgi:hypothetical protein